MPERGRRGPAFWRFLDGIRTSFVERALVMCGSRERAGLVAALGVGDRSALPLEAEEDLAASGLVHLLASSGLHLAVVVLLVREFARRAAALRARLIRVCEELLGPEGAARNREAVAPFNRR